MKKIALFLILLLVLTIYPVFAQDDVDQATNRVVEEATSEEDIGVTPDRPFLYGLKRARERISMALTFNRAAKAKRGLRYALLRKHEIAKMIEEKKLDAAETALKGHEQNMAVVKAAIANIKQDPEKELETAAELEAGVEEQEIKVAKIKIKIKGIELNAEQSEALNELIQSLEDSNADVKIAIKVKADKSETRLRALKQITAKEAEEIRIMIKEKVKERTVRRLETDVGDIEPEETETAPTVSGETAQTTELETEAAVSVNLVKNTTTIAAVNDQLNTDTSEPTRTALDAV